MAFPPLRILSDFRGRIVTRLVAVCAVMSAISGAALFVLESDWLEVVCRNLAAVEARNLAGILAEDGTRAANEARMNAFLAESIRAGRGFFVFAEMRDLKGRLAGRALSPAFAAEIRMFDACEGEHSRIGANRCDRQLINDAVFVRVLVPVTDPTAIEVGRFEGVYRVSPATVDEIRADNVKMFAVTIGAVVLSALAFYPLMMSLQGTVLAEAKDLLRANLDIIKVLGFAVAKRDYGTGAHNLRVTIYSVELARALGLDDAAIRSLIKGALLHDVGKIAVRDSVLLKTGPLDPAEFEEMKSHVRHGLDIIAASKWLDDAAAVVGGHHERVDGGGYPAGVSGDDLPLSARIFAVADVFDALTSERPYKAAMTVAAALAVMDAGRGQHFDGEVLDHFIPIAPALFEQAGHDDEAVMVAMADDLLGRYFRI